MAVLPAALFVGFCIKNSINEDSLRQDVCDSGLNVYLELNWTIAFPSVEAALNNKKAVHCQVCVVNLGLFNWISFLLTKEAIAVYKINLIKTPSLFQSRTLILSCTVDVDCGFQLERSDEGRQKNGKQKGNIERK
ncbi:hypothetical protein MG293_014056 [Ovis ammon polii]|uniref:Uncharacterized protein n=1 Tax=Ovis ammon polii TaxID=230172 RepID=A0AAD4U0M2_OVIAM|nr:hypothetical protein MG293_014056 [Ovis ammon polii]